MRALSQSEYGEIRSLYESIYAPQVDEELEFSDEELEDIVEEVILDLLDEGYDIEEIEESFDDELIDQILIESATVTKGRGGFVKLSSDKRSAPVTSGSGSRMAAASRLDRMKSAQKIARQKERKEKVKATVDLVKDTAKNKMNQAKGAVASAALKATGTKLKGKQGQDLTPQQTHTRHKSVRDKAKAAIKANIRGKVSDAGRAAVDDIRQTAKAARKVGSDIKSAPERAGSAARRGLKGLIRRGAEKVASGASKVAKRMSEEVETYDVVVEFLCDYGIAEDLQEAQWLMVNEIDSEDIENILEAYGIDEAQQIMSVSKGGKQIYKAPRSEPSNEPSPHKKRRMQQLKRAQKNADRRGGDSSPARNRAFDRWVSGTDTPFNRTRTSNIKKLNAPTEPNRSNSDDPYRTVQTDYSARRRRASGS